VEVRPKETRSPVLGDEACVALAVAAGPNADLWGVIQRGARISLTGMPTISTFYGILIRMFFNDHAPPHFHARYGEFEATIDIDTQGVIQGELPRRALNLVQEWAMIHREELLEDWRLCRENTSPAKIEPLA
jgi:hypothetical protein